MSYKDVGITDKEWASTPTRYELMKTQHKSLWNRFTWYFFGYCSPKFEKRKVSYKDDSLQVIFHITYDHRIA